MERINVVLADDHPLLRQGLRCWLEGASDIAVVGEAGEGQKALRLCAELLPQVLLLDMELPGIDGVEVTRQLAGMGSPVGVLAYSGYENAEYVLGAVHAGIAGYLLKNEDPDLLLAAVRGIARGERGWYSPRVAALLAQEALPAGDGALTTRQLQVLRLIAAGQPNREIASTLGISAKTVEKHLTELYARLGVKSRVEAVLRAEREELLGQEGREIPHARVGTGLCQSRVSWAVSGWEGTSES